MTSRLFEQIYDKENRMFYHISYQKFDEFAPKADFSGATNWEDNSGNQLEGIPRVTASCVFLARTKDYAKYYGVMDIKLGATVYKRKVGYMYTVKLLKPLNLFNPRSKEDWNLFKSRFPKEASAFEALTETSFSEKSAYNSKLTKEHLQRNFDIMEPFSKLFKDLGFDGFNVINYFGTQRPEGECIAVFDPKNLKIVNVEEEDTDRKKTKIDFYRIVGEILILRKRFDDGTIRQKLQMKGYSDQIIQKQLEKSDNELLEIIATFLHNDFLVGGKYGSWRAFEGKYEIKKYNSSKGIRDLIDLKHTVVEALMNTFNFEEKDAYEAIQKVYKNETGKSADFSKDPKKQLFGYKID
jgi:hypothetical protein